MHDLAALFQKMALPRGERREPAVVDLRDREAGEDFGVASAEALTHLESISDLIPVVFFHLGEDFVLEDMVGVGAQRTVGVFLVAGIGEGTDKFQRGWRVVTPGDSAGRLAIPGVLLLTLLASLLPAVPPTADAALRVVAGVVGCWWPLRGLRWDGIARKGQVDAGWRGCWRRYRRRAGLGSLAAGVVRAAPQREQNRLPAANDDPQLAQ